MAGLSGAYAGVLTTLCYIVAQSILKSTVYEHGIIKSYSKKEIIFSLLAIFVLGTLWGVFNLLSMNPDYSNISFQIPYLTNALRAGIWEEISFRYYLFSLFVYFYNKSSLKNLAASAASIEENPKLGTRKNAMPIWAKILAYIIMIVPHVLIHFQSFSDPQFFTGLIYMSLIFGLPMTILQRKLNLISAIGFHVWIDLIRFMVLGLPSF